MMGNVCLASKSHEHEPVRHPDGSIIHLQRVQVRADTGDMTVQICKHCGSVYAVEIGKEKS